MRELYRQCLDSNYAEGLRLDFGAAKRAFKISIFFFFEMCSFLFIYLFIYLHFIFFSFFLSSFFLFFFSSSSPFLLSYPLLSFLLSFSSFLPTLSFFFFFNFSSHSRPDQTALVHAAHACIQIRVCPDFGGAVPSLHPKVHHSFEFSASQGVTPEQLVYQLAGSVAFIFFLKKK